MGHKGWYSRGYLPHFDSAELVQMVSFRLVDALPVEVLKRLETEYESESDVDKAKKIEEYLNTGYGSCFLRDPRVAIIVEEALKFFDSKCYSLIAWVIMPNHVHVLMEVKEGFELPKIVHSWKSFSANKANKILKRNGKFWQREYFDRFIRDDKHFAEALEYIHYNPVKAGLVEIPEDWEFSSAKQFRS